MSINSICFHAEIKKNIIWVPLLSIWSYVYTIHNGSDVRWPTLWCNKGVESSNITALINFTGAAINFISAEIFLSVH